MRDALSLLDQCTGHGDTIDADVVCSVAGMTGKDHLFSLADCVSENSSAKALEKLSDLHANSCDMERLCSDMINHFRNLMVVKTVKSAESILVCTADELEQYKNQSNKFTLENILYCISLLQEAMANIKKGVNRRIEMEMTFIKLTTPSVSVDAENLSRRISQIENKLKNGNFTVSSSVKENSDATVKSEASVTEKSASAPETAPYDESADAPAEEALPWAEVMSELTNLNMPLWGVLNGSSAVIQGDFVLIKSDNPTLSAFIRTGTNARDVKTAIKRVTGKDYRLGLYKDSNASAAVPSAPTAKKDPLENLISKARDMGINVDLNN